VKLGANCSLKDSRGLTAYDYALKSGDKRLALLLELPWSVPKVSEFGYKDKLVLYARFLRYSSANRWHELRFWVGVAITVVQMASKF